MRSKCMSLLPRTTLHSDSEQLVSVVVSMSGTTGQHSAGISAAAATRLISAGGGGGGVQEKG